MKRLWLLRHAKAVPADKASADFARRLAERGEHDAHRIGERLARQSPLPTAILASPSARTRRTAEIVADVLKQPGLVTTFDDRLYLGSAAMLATVIAASDPRLDALLVVGHNPGLSELALELVTRLPVDDLPTSGLVGIDIASEAWSGLDGAEKRLRYYDFPKNDGPPLTLR